MNLLFIKVLVVWIVLKKSYGEEVVRIAERAIRGPEDTRGWGVTLKRFGDIVFEVFAPTEKPIPEVIFKPGDVSVKSNQFQVKSMLNKVAFAQTSPPEDVPFTPVPTIPPRETFFRPNFAKPATQIQQPQTTQWPSFVGPHSPQAQRPQAPQNSRVQASRPQATTPWWQGTTRRPPPAPVSVRQPTFAPVFAPSKPQSTLPWWQTTTRRPSSTQQPPQLFRQPPPRPFERPQTPARHPQPQPQPTFQRPTTQKPQVFQTRPPPSRPIPQRAPETPKSTNKKTVFFDEKRKIEKFGPTAQEQSAIKPTYKPPIIHHPPPKHQGPTYNCRVLVPEQDGKPSSGSDPSCRMKYPGFPAEGESCYCTYDVAGRDENGCASGFLYTCHRLG